MSDSFCSQPRTSVKKGRTNGEASMDCKLRPMSSRSTVICKHMHTLAWMCSQIHAKHANMNALADKHTHASRMHKALQTLGAKTSKKYCVFHMLQPNTCSSERGQQEGAHWSI
eukprot:scaffold115055_cov14-Tisochrysis_lutea.AAC.1